MRVYCVGNDPVVLRLRKLVLETAGFTVSGAPPVQAVNELPTIQVDVVIISADVNSEDRGTLKAALGAGFPLIELQRFIGPHDLIKAVNAYAPG
jgi:hypothetical protein